MKLFNINKKIEDKEKYQIKITELNSGKKSYMPQYHTGGIMDSWSNLIMLETDSIKFAEDVIKHYKKRLAFERSVKIKAETYVAA
jgi:hypothetical protein